MSGSNARSNAIRAITSYKPDLAPLNYADTKPTEIYGSNVFSDKVMKERLPRIVYSPARPSSRGPARSFAGGHRGFHHEGLGHRRALPTSRTYFIP